MSILRTGSSPRVRGKLQGDGVGVVSGRLIPARAGKTPVRRRRVARRPAHPRACGENARPTTSTAPPPGSSPRVRGKRRTRRPGRAVTGLIPARAGKTAQCSPRGWDRWAHPRACGENPASGLGVSISAGSSPRVRGKRWHSRHEATGRRLIPARAGKTCGGSSSPSWTWAHPRACGENWAAWSDQAGAHGSSPRVRGKHEQVLAVRPVGRLIPARAGKTPPPLRRWRGCRAHPRACGENLSTAVTRTR